MSNASKNVFNATIEQGTITINGDLAADNRIRTKEYINIDSNYITLSWNSEQNIEAYIMMYDANEGYVRGEGWVTSPVTKQILSNVKKIRIIWRYASQADIVPSAVNSVKVWNDLQPKIYENGAFVDTTNNPKKYNNGSWS